MNWWKISQTTVQYLSHNSYGDLSLSINGKKYQYININPILRAEIIRLIKYNSFKKLFELLSKQTQLEKRTNQLDLPYGNQNEKTT